jgi:hypothetical protein
VCAKSLEVFRQGSVCGGTRASVDPVPSTVVELAAVDVRAFRETVRKPLAIAVFQLEVPLNDGDRRRINNFRLNVVQLGSRIVTERVETLDFLRRMELLQRLEDDGLSRFVRADEDRLPLFDFKQPCVLDAAVLADSSLDESHFVSPIDLQAP